MKKGRKIHRDTATKWTNITPTPLIPTQLGPAPALPCPVLPCPVLPPAHWEAAAAAAAWLRDEYLRALPLSEDGGPATVPEPWP